MKFTAADVHCLNAAEGWLELGNYFEADKELDNTTPQLRADPAVLQLRWSRKPVSFRHHMEVALQLAVVRDEESRAARFGLIVSR